jgi:hypothetical protein
MVLFDFDPNDFTTLSADFQKKAKRFLYKPVDNADDQGCWADVYLPTSEAFAGPRPVGEHGSCGWLSICNWS